MKEKLLSILFLLVVSWTAMFAQTTLTGRVLDGNGQPVPGATVVEKGTTNGTVADMDGNYSLKAQSDATLVVSFIGMTTVEHQGGGDVVLEDETHGLDEVVAIGYGNTVRRDLTGSVGSISGDKLATTPVASAGEALAGKVAGVQVTTVDGAPGADINIRVRGGTSVTQSNQPLFIVDGFPTDNINDIPPTDIQSIDILKDASLTAIYGAKGGNGVVIVTTKGAQEGKMKVDFNMYHQISMLAKHIEVLDPYEFMLYSSEAVEFSQSNSNRRTWRKNWGNTLGMENDLELWKNIEGVDWEDEIMGSHPFSHMYNVTMSGGNEKMKANVSLTHNDQQGILKGSGVVRTNMNLKLSIKFNDYVKLLINPRITYRRDTGAGADNVGKNGIVGVLRYHPVDGIRTTGRWSDNLQNEDEEDAFAITNPLNEIDENYNKKHSYSFTNQASLEITPIKGLVFKSDIALFNSFSDQNQFYGHLSASTNNTTDNGHPKLNTTNSRTNKLSWTNTLSYSKSFEQIHNFNFLIGQEMQQQFGSKEVMSEYLFPENTTAAQAIANAQLGTSKGNTSTITTPVKMSSFFGQISYNYDHKYLVSGTFRADGSTKFAPGKQWGYFPAASAAWVISREDFMDFDWLSNLKLRAAVGLSGNNNISNDLWHYSYATSTSGSVAFAENGDPKQSGDNYYRNSSNTTLPNPSIKWETTTDRNLALDMGFLEGKLEITPEIYWKTTKDLLLEAEIPLTTGYRKQMQNVGQTTNKGIEISVNYNIIQTEDARLDFNFNLGRNKSKIDKLNGTEKTMQAPGNRWGSKYDDRSYGSDYLVKEGEQVGLLYGFVYDGIYTFDDFEFDKVNSRWSTNTWDGSRLDDNGNVVVKGTTSNYHLKDGVAYNTVYTTGDLQPGDVKFRDLDGNGYIDERDRKVIGNTTPKLQGGFGLSGSYKWFDMTMNFNYMLGFDVYNANAYMLSSSKLNTTNPTNILKDFASNSRGRYLKESTGDNMPTDMSLQQSDYVAINSGRSLWNPTRINDTKVIHSYFVEDGSFLRLQDVTIGYTFDKALTEKIKCQKARIYFTGSNLFCATKYSGYDPEVDIQSGLVPSMDYNRYPRSRGFLLGVNLTF